MNLLTRSLIALFVFLTMTVTVEQSKAQENASEACKLLVRDALAQVGSNCADLGRNEACYGFNQIQSIFDTKADNPQLLSEPGDQTLITDVAVIDSSEVNLRNGWWGIAPISVQANLPVALPGRDLVLIPIGDVDVENGVKPADALLLPAEALKFTVSAQTPLRLEPSASSEMVGQAAAGTPLEADGISPDGKWLRVYYEHEREYSTRSTAWLDVGTLSSQLDTSSLPRIQPDSMTPMQKFYLRNAFKTPECSNIPSPLLFVQGPESIETDFVVNGAKVRISSTITLRLLSPGNVMELAVLSGIATLNPDTRNPLVIPAGFATTICLSELRNLGIDGVENDREVIAGCNWTTPRQLTQNELGMMSLLQQIPVNILNYRFRLPRLVCPSGVGQPVCEIIVDDPRLLQLLRILCRRGILPPWICRLIRGI